LGSKVKWARAKTRKPDLIIFQNLSGLSTERANNQQAFTPPILTCSIILTENGEFYQSAAVYRCHFSKGWHLWSRVPFPENEKLPRTMSRRERNRGLDLTGLEDLSGLLRK